MISHSSHGPYTKNASNLFQFKMKSFPKTASNPTLPLFIEGVRRSREGVQSKIDSFLSFSFYLLS